MAIKNNIIFNMGTNAKLIKGGVFSDERGNISFVNDLNLNPVKRFYIITNANTKTIRAWQAHKIEKRWFYCIKGKIDLRLVKIDNFQNPSNNLTVNNFILSEEKSQILEVPNGYANGFRALEDNSQLLVFSNYELNSNIDDDFRFESKKWTNWEEQLTYKKNKRCII
ncbi:WxcM-like domain-containing protein [uncultured Maribacter sp.]|uniref:WxcM-like domain-containing protein n=1 Tax=uncultured Maribacter sp. TaxID=431308 RepID=UPI00262CB037|nr:WxcM-like domain-containing protein [uncultured Maribacter sp.]